MTDAASTTIFACATCSKKLKLRATLVGKKVKCPHCGAVMPTVSPPPIWRIVVPPLIVALVLWATFVLQLRNLDHTALTRWDEVFHAVVAQTS